MTTRRFTGQYHEQALPGGEGLAYYNARWYDPALGRFVSPDSIVPEPGDPQDFNRYSYVRNNPLNFIDPTGHYTFEDEPDDQFFVPPQRYPQFNPTRQAMRKRDFRCMAQCGRQASARTIGVSISVSDSKGILKFGVNLARRLLRIPESVQTSGAYGIERVSHENGRSEFFFVYGRSIDFGPERGNLLGKDKNLGAGAIISAYYGWIFGLDDIDDMAGKYRGSALNLARGPLGLSNRGLSHIETDTYLETIGWAGGASLEVDGVQLTYVPMKTVPGIIGDHIPEQIKAFPLELMKLIWQVHPDRPMPIGIGP